MGSRAEGAQQPAPLLEIESRALHRQSNELFVSAPPGDGRVNVFESDHRY